MVMIPLLLMSLIVIASANDYGYTPKPDYHEEKPKPQEKPLPTKPESLPGKPDFENSHPAGVDELLPTIIGIQGTVLCKLGSKYFALQGILDLFV